MTWYHPSNIGFSVRRQLADVGHGARLFTRLLGTLLGSFKRFGLIRDHIHFLGNYSLVIIAVSGLFVGFVLGLQGYYTLQRYGSTEALGLLVALSLVRELGPVADHELERDVWPRGRALVPRVDALLAALSALQSALG